MPKIIDPKIRKDASVRMRISYALLNKSKELANKKGISLSDLIRQLLQDELNKPT